jgi:hypothetical protein
VLRRSRVRRTRHGTYRIELPPDERRVLRSLLDQLRELLTSGAPDDRRRRLYPTAYAGDAGAEEEYQSFMREELSSSRLAAIDAAAATLDETELTAEQLDAWMGSVNAVRLVLGTMLDVTEDLDMNTVSPDDPEIETYVLYSYLSFLLEELIRAGRP